MIDPSTKRNKKGKRRPWPTAFRELDFPAVLSLPDGSSRGCHKNTASEIRFIGKKTMQQVKVVMPIENLYVRATARTRPGNDVGKPVAVHIARGHSNATGEGCIKRKEAQQDCVRSPVKDFHVWSPARTGAGNDVGCRVAVNVTGSYIDTTGQVCIVGKETLQQGQVHSVKDFHVRPAARARSGNDIGAPIPVNVAGGHAHAACEKRRISKETKKRVTGGAVEHSHYWQSTTIRTDNDVGLAVAIDVAGCHIYTATIKAREREEAANKTAAYSVKHSYMRPHSGPGSGDDVSKAIAVDIANSHTNAAGKTSSIGRKGKRIIPGLAVNCDLLHDGRMARVRANGQNRKCRKNARGKIA